MVIVLRVVSGFLIIVQAKSIYKRNKAIVNSFRRGVRLNDE